MFAYTALSAILGIVIGIALAVRTKRVNVLCVGALDRIGVLTNILLLVAYVCAAPFCMFIGIISEPRCEGFMGALGWIVAIIIGSSTMICALGLGFSVALRRRGRSRLSFAVQLAGVVGIALAFILYGVFEGSLIGTLN